MYRKSIVIIGIGADDAFIFCKVWQCAKTEKDNGTLVKLVHDTLKHATLSMFVTTLTTAAAFYASYVSSITAIGTATLANFALMVTWLPASVVVSERWNCPFQWMTWDNTLRPVRNVTNRVRVSLDRYLVLSVTRLRYMWFVILGSLAVASTVVIFYHPRLKLPDTKNFQLFDSSHLFEQYDMVYKDMFWFERLQKLQLEESIVWIWAGESSSVNIALPCLALPCLALPCLALPCLALGPSTIHTTPVHATQTLDSLVHSRSHWLRTKN
uniref:Patched domain-containing protein n=1 Tax=Timema douglasi TaxID=61478 RepID=A0A7R8VQJ1_TIMDO|nr:unnamed protein product [Timema douglasi]